MTVLTREAFYLFFFLSLFQPALIFLGEVLAVFPNMILPLGLDSFMQRTALIVVMQSDLGLSISLLIAFLAYDHTDLSQ